MRFCEIAIVAEHLKFFWIVVPFKPFIEIGTAYHFAKTYLTPMGVSSTVDMVYY